MSIRASTERSERFISCVETAKLVRSALKREFPSVRFSVRSERYSLGASIHVHWVGGPERDAVEQVACAYQGARFDGMIDLQTHVTHYLTADGRAVVAEDHGTASMGGMMESHRAFKPTPDAERVRFGADYIFCCREMSSHEGVAA